jgi:hypothetical protein
VLVRGERGVLVRGESNVGVGGTFVGVIMVFYLLPE